MCAYVFLQLSVFTNSASTKSILNTLQININIYVNSANVTEQQWDSTNAKETNGTSHIGFLLDKSLFTVDWAMTLSGWGKYVTSKKILLLVLATEGSFQIIQNLEKCWIWKKQKPKNLLPGTTNGFLGLTQAFCLKANSSHCLHLTGQQRTVCMFYHRRMTLTTWFLFG